MKYPSKILHCKFKKKLVWKGNRIRKSHPSGTFIYVTIQLVYTAVHSIKEPSKGDDV